MNILLIEDDAKTADHIARGLRRTGQTVEVVHDGASGLARANGNAFDVLIVDRMLPGLDGLSLVKQARAAGLKAPVLLLTSMDGIKDRVEGLEGGADDYLVKPYSFDELNARVNALARRPPLRDEDTTLAVADLTLDRLRRIVKRGGQVIDLQPREFQLLQELMLNRDRVVTRSMLLERVWDVHFDPGTNVVESHLSRLRAKIDRGCDVPLIHTVRGEGYVLRGE
jgi:two-component system OmpR family response regulator